MKSPLPCLLKNTLLDYLNRSTVQTIKWCLTCLTILFISPESLIHVLLQLGVMTYTDVTKQSPETQAAIEQEVRLLLKVSFHTLSDCYWFRLIVYECIYFVHFIVYLPLIHQLCSFSRTPMSVLKTSWRLTVRSTRH